MLMQFKSFSGNLLQQSVHKFNTNRPQSNKIQQGEVKKMR